ncbi:hypothetical protein MMC25_007635 [Agyrium rufum]|nr:hypothetical protein [Agyrium rufum]
MGDAAHTFEQRPLLLYATDASQVDKQHLEYWREEGFDVHTLSSTSMEEQINSLLRDLESEDKRYAVVAYGEPADSLFAAYTAESIPKPCAFVAFYPTKLPDVAPKSILFHLAADASVESTAELAHYVYQETKPGFAERTRDTYSKLHERLAWTRSLEAVRQGFGIKVDLEKVWEEHLALEFAVKDADATMATMVPEPYVNHIPTLTGGIGFKDLRRFYADFFIPSNPPNMALKLLSRTIGTDRVVDEIFISFTHTVEIPWMLPGVTPTGKPVEVALVSVVCIRGGKLYHEHIYWDQATVLVQIGMLDPNLVPSGFEGSKKLPVVGREGARKVIDESCVQSNELISGW